MGVSLEIHRMRIGRFGPGRGFSGERLSKQKYNANAGRTDIHLRVFVTAFLLTSILFLCERTLAYGILNYDLSTLMGPDICYRSSINMNILTAAPELANDMSNKCTLSESFHL